VKACRGAIDRFLTVVRRRAIAGYRWIAEPRHERIIQALIYGCIAVGGLLTISVIPVLIENLVGYWGTVGLAGLTAIGGIIGLIGVLPDNRPLERLGATTNSLAYGLYAVVLWGLGASPLAVSISIAFSLVMLLRLVQIRGLSPVNPRPPEEDR
jgi:hypothetical protein